MKLQVELRVPPVFSMEQSPPAACRWSFAPPAVTLATKVKQRCLHHFAEK
jgi:hypothetical protein